MNVMPLFLSDGGRFDAKRFHSRTRSLPVFPAFRQPISESRLRDRKCRTNANASSLEGALAKGNQAHSALLDYMVELDLNTFLATARAFDPSPGSATEDQARSFDRDLAGVEELLARKPHELPNLFDALLVSRSSLAWLYLLEALAKSVEQKAFEIIFIDKFQYFVKECCHVQVKANPNKLAFVTRSYTQAMVRLGRARQAIPHIELAIKIVRPTGEHLTPQMADLLQVCLVSKCYSRGNQLLNEDVHEVSPHETGCTATDVLLYLYYGAIVQIGEKKFQNAKHFLKQAIGIPASVLSLIVVESYKKFILVSLICDGTADGIPKYTSSVVQRQIKGYVAEYIDFSGAFKSRDTQSLLELVEHHQHVFRQDGNFGLVKQCISSYYKGSILRLTKTYLTLSVRDIAKTVGLDSDREAEHCLLRMIAAHEIHAKINQQEGTIHFEEDPEDFGSYESLEVLDRTVKNLRDLSRKIQQTDRNVSLDRNYQSRMNAKSSFGLGFDEGGILDTTNFG